jgi:hypothetical protein
VEALAQVRAHCAPNAEVRLDTAARAGAPVRRVLATLAGQLVVSKAWDRLGYVRQRDYVVERLGLSARQVQDLAHVDRALRGLPRIEAAFVAGEITWTKTRLVCRVATPEDEAAWLDLAKRLTARALAREVRAVDARSLEAAGLAETDEDGSEEVPRETVWLRVTPRVRARWGRARLLARQVAGEALSQAQAAEMIAAEVLSALGTDLPGLATPLHFSRAEPPILPGRESGRSERIPPHAAGAPRAKPSTLLPILPAFLAPLLDNLESIDAALLDARLRRALRIEQRLLSEMAPLLLEVARSRAYRWRGFPNLAAFARERLGMSPRKAQALVRLERAGELCPELRAAFRSGSLSWVQAHALVPILALEQSQPWRAAWVTHAAAVTVRRLEDDVERATVTGQLDPSSHSEEVQTGAHSTVQNETIHLFFTAPADVVRLFNAVLATVQRRIERRSGCAASESEALDAMLEHCFAAWSPENAKIPPDHRVFERDGWRCTVPGCSSYRNLHSHHIVFRSHHGPDDAWNRTALCAAHHQRCVHEGLGRIRIRGRAPGGLTFELPLVTYGPGERILL